MTTFPIGIHAGVNGPSPLPYVRAINALGYGAFVKIVNSGGRALEAAQADPRNVVVFRLTKETGPPENPDYSLDPRVAAERHWAQIAPNLPGELPAGVWLETCNEPDRARWDWLGWYAYYMAANHVLPAGFSFCGPAANSGEPEPADWDTEGWRMFLTFAADRPDEVALSVHQYNWDNLPFEEVFPWHVGRERDVRAVCDRHGIAYPTIWVTEWGFAYDHVPAWSECETFIRHCVDYYGSRGMAAALWAYQSEFVSNEAHALEPYLVALANGWRGEEPPSPPPSTETWQEELWRVSVAEQIEHGLQLNPNAGFQKVIFSLPGRFTPVTRERRHTPAADRVRRGYQAAEDVETGERVLIVAPADDLANVTVLTDPAVDPPPNHLSVIPLSQRDPRWAGATLGQPTGHGETIGSWGCLLVAYTMMANHMGLADDDPQEMNARMVAAGAFSAQFIRPAALRTTFPDGVTYHGYKRRDDPAMTDDIASYLGDKIPVPARVDFVPATSPREQHWCLVIGGGPDSWIVADPWTGKIGPLADVYGIAGEDVLEALFYRPVEDTPPPPPPGPRLDLAAFFLPDGPAGRPFELRRPDGSQERVQLQRGAGDRVYITKGTGGLGGRAEWEALRVGDDFIWRGVDTSPGRGHYYIQYESGRTMARWCPRYMAVGETWIGPGHRAQFFDKQTCQPARPESSGPATNRATLDWYAPTWTSPHGVTVRDVIQLTTATGEVMRFAAGLGLVGWESAWGNSAISELFDLGERPDNVREEIPCNLDDVNGDGVQDDPPPDSPAHYE